MDVTAHGIEGEHVDVANGAGVVPSGHSNVVRRARDPNPSQPFHHAGTPSIVPIFMPIVIMETALLVVASPLLVNLPATPKQGLRQITDLIRPFVVATLSGGN